MATLFSKIIKGKIPSYKCAEDDNFYAFLDINPVRPGHTLVVPKQEVDYIFDLSDEMLSKMIVFAKRVAIALKQARPCRKIGVAVIGLEVNHAHIHLVPMNEEGDLNFSKPKLTLPAEEMQAIADQVYANYKALSK